MAVPKQRHTKSRRNRRRSHHALKKRSFAVCAKCGFAVMSHHICQNCGTYAGREVIDVLKKIDKKGKENERKRINRTRKRASGRKRTEYGRPLKEIES